MTMMYTSMTETYLSPRLKPTWSKMLYITGQMRKQMEVCSKKASR